MISYRAILRSTVLHALVAALLLGPALAHAQASLSGTWLDDRRGARLVLVQNGDRLTGTYFGGRGHESLRGQLNARRRGDVFVGTYTSSEGVVRGRAVMEVHPAGPDTIEFGGQGSWSGGGTSGSTSGYDRLRRDGSTPSQPPDASACAATRDCSACTQTPGCGWCGATNSCVPAGSGNAACGPSFVWTAANCAAMWTPPANTLHPITGTWNSNYGPITITHGSITPGQVVPITGGSWDQGSGRIGQITGGTYNPTTQVVTFTYYQSWNNLTGTAQLTVSSDGRSMSGTFSQPNGSGRWTMQR